MKLNLLRLVAIYFAFFLGWHASDVSRSHRQLQAQVPAKNIAPDVLAEMQKYVPRDSLAIAQLNVKDLRENKPLAKLLTENQLFKGMNPSPDDQGIPTGDWAIHGVLPPPLDQDAGKWMPLLMVNGSAAPLAPMNMGKDRPEDAPKFIKVTIPELGLPVSVLDRSEELAMQNWQKRGCFFEPNTLTRLYVMRGRTFLQVLKPQSEVRDAGWQALLPLQNIKQSGFVAAVDLVRLRQMPAQQQNQLHPAVNQNPTLSRLVYLFGQYADQAVVGVNFKNGVQLTAIIQTADASHAVEFKKAVEEQLQSLRQKLPQHLDLIRQLKFADPGLATQLSSEIHALYNSIQLVQKDNLFRLTMQADQKLFEILATAQADSNLGSIPVLKPELPEPAGLKQTKSGSAKSP